MTLANLFENPVPRPQPCSFSCAVGYQAVGKGRLYLPRKSGANGRPELGVTTGDTKGLGVRNQVFYTLCTGDIFGGFPRETPVGPLLLR